MGAWMGWRIKRITAVEKGLGIFLTCCVWGVYLTPNSRCWVSTVLEGWTGEPSGQRWHSKPWHCRGFFKGLNYSKKKPKKWALECSSHLETAEDTWGLMPVKTLLGKRAWVVALDASSGDQKMRPEAWLCSSTKWRSTETLVTKIMGTGLRMNRRGEIENELEESSPGAPE